MTYEELLELAKKHYNRGGDMVLECWDERFYNEYICMFGPISEKQALQLFETNYYIQQDIEKAQCEVNRMKCPCCDNTGLFDRLEIFGGYGDPITEIIECTECCAVFTISYQNGEIDRIIERGENDD